MAALMSACSKSSSKSPSEENPAAKVEQIEGTDLTRVILSVDAAKRLDVQTAPIREEQVTRKGAAAPQLRKIIPYAAVLYGVEGDAFVYTSPKAETFVRAPIKIDYIEGDRAILLDGPASGTAVVTVGAAELFGTEFVFEEK
jgi:hypothetical protein